MTNYTIKCRKENGYYADITLPSGKTPHTTGPWPTEKQATTAARLWIKGTNATDLRTKAAIQNQLNNLSLIRK